MTADVETLTIDQLAKRWKCRRIGIYAAIKEGRLAAFRIGKRVYRVTLDEVLRFEKARAA